MEAAEAARRCKTKGGQNGLLGSASPRSCRRSRRRSEVVVVEEETKPVVVVLNDEKAAKQRKHKKTGRSKKEKQSSLPSPSSDLSKGPNFNYFNFLFVLI